MPTESLKGFFYLKKIMGLNTYRCYNEFNGDEVSFFLYGEGEKAGFQIQEEAGCNENVLQEFTIRISIEDTEGLMTYLNEYISKHKK